MKTATIYETIRRGDTLLYVYQIQLKTESGTVDLDLTEAESITANIRTAPNSKGKLLFGLSLDNGIIINPDDLGNSYMALRIEKSETEGLPVAKLYCDVAVEQSSEYDEEDRFTYFTIIIEVTDSI